MHHFIPVAVSLLCVILGNGDKLAAASNDDKSDDEKEEQIPIVADSTDSIEESNASLTEDAVLFEYDYEPSTRSLENAKTRHHYYIVHGLNGNMYEKWINDTSKTILKHISNIRVARFGYSKAAALGYVSAVNAVKRKVGKQLGHHIINAYKKGKVSLDKTTLIGYGLGAHVVGIAGKKIFKKLGKKVERIIGLSPAGPIFHVTSKKRKLQKGDAKCVAVLHTDRILLGYKFASGGLDFYANGGTYQPGCENIFSECSHRRSRLYFIEAFDKAAVPELEQARSLGSNNDKKKFIDMVHGDCSMGNGSYIFKTNSKPPYLLDN